jgi:hypothetical protein
VDLGCVAVASAMIGPMFDAMIFSEVAFDDAWIASLTPLRVDDFEDFCDGDFGSPLPVTRGKSRLVR